jgi:hypothetical protein
MTFRSRASGCIVALLLSALSAAACSVLSHEAVVDAVWDVKLKPALLVHFPNSTPEQLKTAHGYAYGGSIIQDLGYYPRGSKQFSDLAHYVRTGDFIVALIHEAHDLNELAFAYGALTHYISDIDVHSHATNIGEPMLYPRVREKYGPVVTYEKDPGAHLATEFGFDVLEVAKANFAPQAYHDFIGFFIASDVLDRALQDTFGLSVKELFPNFDRSIGSYRRDISNLIPKATRIAWAQRQDQIRQATPNITERQFIYVMNRSSYERSWGKQYDVPSRGERVLAFLLKLLPPIGPLRHLKFRVPTPPVEKLFMSSFDLAVKDTTTDLAAAQKPDVDLNDINYDVGSIVKPGQYRLEDDSYADWLHLLAKKNFSGTSDQMKSKILAYYGDLQQPLSTKRYKNRWLQLQSELESLKRAPVGADKIALGE